MKAGAMMPRDYTPDGKNVSPPLTWSNVPAGTREFAVVCEDFDAGNPPPFVHWVIYKIPGTAKGLPENIPIDTGIPMPAGIAGALQGLNGFKRAMFEPGRVLVGAAGVLLARVVDVKHLPGAKRFVVLDAGMTELMRPALYGAFHRIEPVHDRPGTPIACDVVGPICESTDTFARDRILPPMEVGDLVVIRDCGAYSAVMGSNYLRRPLPPEVLVDGGHWRVIRRRQTLEDMLALEVG